MFKFVSKNRKRRTLAAVLGFVLTVATTAAAAWTIYTLTIAPGGVGGSSNGASTTMGAFVLTAGTPSQPGQPSQPADIAIHVVNQDGASSHSFGTVTVGNPTITGGSGGCTLANLTNTTLATIQTNVNATLAASPTVTQGSTKDYDATGAYTLASTAPIGCAGTTITWPISGTLAN